jgi:hypothetical protein
MPQVEITFDGICTFFNGAGLNPPLPVDERVVLLDLSGGNNSIAGVARIPRHFATMRINDEPEEPLDGIAIKIVAEPAVAFTLPPEPGSVLSSFMQLIPNLTSMVQPIEAMAPPSDAIAGTIRSPITWPAISTSSAAPSPANTSRWEAEPRHRRAC